MTGIFISPHNKQWHQVRWGSSTNTTPAPNPVPPGFSPANVLLGLLKCIMKVYLSYRNMTNNYALMILDYTLMQYSVTCFCAKSNIISAMMYCHSPFGINNSEESACTYVITITSFTWWKNSICHLEAQAVNLRNQITIEYVYSACTYHNNYGQRALYCLLLFWNLPQKVVEFFWCVPVWTNQ